ncbi:MULTISPECIES: hypothetical protein [Henriciella]|uniref:hypothetical protein n=1 Tax=Henriciella TaxID=453849 RepID=UPI00351982E0
MTFTTGRLLGAAAISVTLCGFAANAQSENANPNARANGVFAHWTQERIDSAIPRDLVLDHRGVAYMRDANGVLRGHGHNRPYELKVKAVKPAPAPQAKPPSNNDTTPPTISGRSPSDGATIGTAQVFSAEVTDASGVKSVTFNINYTGGSQSFSGTLVGGDTYEVSLSGFPTGPGSWTVTATDTAKRGGNSATSSSYAFTVGGGGDPGPGGDTVANERWSDGGPIQDVTGRLLYEMPTNRRGTRWAAYVCSGTVATDGASSRSVIITAAHCVFDDVSKKFARNVLFIPNQDQTTGSGTDSNCANDPVGCWAPTFGAVDVNWTTRSFPDNIPWDYAYYVVEDSGAHSGSASTSDALDTAVGSLGIDFSPPAVNDGNDGATSADFTHALGYSYSDDPYFMYCAEDMTTEGTDNWWLPGCGLSGGSSGGPWIQPLSNGTGPIISVNSWGYNGSPGMAGPKLNGTSAQCVFDEAVSTPFNNVLTGDGQAGISVDGC